ncbi:MULTISPECIES: acyl-CoA dehydrogenase [unclassified Streptomyces]|uniref:acyl-CoA dehydrogenase n=1 Tax=unclassified Streptomyces TaxID=2593676 RepID=UPI00037114CA|nr:MULTISPECIES: acyl-CoA dehydrogenase [unclassified Streptomyces]MYT29277.1 acyl-CoA dehydrogenase [Streptomyces sp. SID8354]
MSPESCADTLGLTREHRELAAATRAFLGHLLPKEELRRHLEPAGLPAYWAKLAGQGLLGLHLPHDCGGAGGGPLDLAVALEESGRALLPGPYLPTVLAADLLHRAGRTALVRDLAAGHRSAAVALPADGPTLSLTEHGTDALRLAGRVAAVPGGHLANLLLLPAGDRWVVIDASALTVRPLPGTGLLLPAAEIVAEDVILPAARVLPGVDTALVRDLALVYSAAQACGVAAWSVATAAEHARTRQQFGRPIGQFQGVKHLCAEMLVRLARSRVLTWDAARAVAEGAPTKERGYTAALAATALETAVSNAEDCVQILGGTGFTWEHDAHLALRHAAVLRHHLGAGHSGRAARAALSGVRRELSVPLPEAAPVRARAREALAAARGLNPRDARRALAPTGYAAPHLPHPYGLGADALEQLVIEEELRAAGVTLSELGIGTWVLPTVINHGSEAQRTRLIPPTLSGELTWCQLFSEPDAGSDLAALRTRATPAPSGQGWRVSGQKVWTSAARQADWGLLLARTGPQESRHRDLTCFVIAMDSTGISVRPLTDLTGGAVFTEVFLDEVHLPPDAVLGEPGQGWAVIRQTLGDERVHMTGQVTPGTGLETLLTHTPADPDQLGGLLADAHALTCIAYRGLLQRLHADRPGADAAVRKLLHTRHEQAVAALALRHEGPYGEALRDYLFSRSLTIAGGTTQIQRNLVAEQQLGLPRDPRP